MTGGTSVRANFFFDRSMERAGREDIDDADCSSITCVQRIVEAQSHDRLVCQSIVFTAD